MFLNLTRLFHEYCFHFFTGFFYNKLFYYLVLSHKRLCYSCLWNFRNRICFLYSYIQYLLWTKLESAAPNLSILFTQTRHPFLGSTLCTQHDEAWLRSCRISTHIQTHSLPPYVLVSPLFLFLRFFERIRGFFAAILVKRIQKTSSRRTNEVRTADSAVRGL
jgi:hypothetical protein